MRTRLLRALSLFPVVLLLIVAGWQAIRIETHNQSPWIGGGFSMFSFVDNAIDRAIMVTETDDPTVSISVPADLAREAERMAAAPTDARATRFARELATRRGVAVTVEVWRPVWDADDLVVTAELLASGDHRP